MEKLRKVVGSLSLVLLFLTTIQQFYQLSRFIDIYFWHIIIIGWLLCVYAFWPKKERRMGFSVPDKRRKKNHLSSNSSIIIIISFLFVLVGLYRWYDVYLYEENGDNYYPAPSPSIKPNKTTSQTVLLDEKQVAEFLHISYSRKLKSPTLKLSLAENTSFVEKSEPFSSDDYEKYQEYLKKGELRTFVLDEFLLEDECTCNDFYSTRIREILAKIAIDKGKMDLIKYFETDELLESLPRRRPSILKILLPDINDRYLAYYDIDRYSQREIINWIKCCAGGIPYPSFNILIENQEPNKLIIHSINYEVLDLGGVKGGGGGTIIPSEVYVHKLEYKTGLQKYELSEPFLIDGKSVEMLQIQLYTDEPDVGLAWLMNIGFETNQGLYKTENFQLIMSGTPEWADGIRK